MMVALTAMAGGATPQTLSVQPIEAQTGEQTEVVVSLTGGTAMTALQFNLKLPEGLTFGDGDATTGAATDGHTLSVQTLDGGDRLFVLYSMEQKTFGDGELLRIPVTAGSAATTGEGRLYTVRTATAEAVSHGCANAAFTMTVKGGGGDMERVTIDDITRLIQQYLTPGSETTIDEITALISRYLAQQEQ